MANDSQSAAPQRGLRYWMEQVVAEAEKAREAFKADPVHDLRVAIRRCRSMAEAFGTIDPEPAWKKMRSAAKPVFSALGDLRDVQIQMEWVEKLSEENDPVRAKLMDHFHQREQELKATAADALAAFDINQWRQWTTFLDQRSQLLPPGGEVFQLMALERWRNARELQTTALRNRSKNALHALRIGIKKFRYIAENFLPDLYENWQKDLKKVQDLLGEIHDLDVLGDTARAIHAFDTPQHRQQWTTTIQRERRQRLDAYRAKMVGKHTLWQEWRSGLPDGETLHMAVLKTFETWSQFRDPDFAHTRRVLAMSLAIFDELEQRSQQFGGVNLRDLLTVAALTHEVGRGKQRKHHKQTVHMLDRLDTPPGWSPIHLHVAGMIARYHRGALPNESQKLYAELPADAKRIVNFLGGIVRLADALDRRSSGSVAKIKVTKSNCMLTIQASGYDTQSKAAEQIAAAGHLLESAISLPIVVKEK
jgi:exopolyphosphatase/guanosine-5'-triphosphate,3'-diphosphate pyrophosphatase